MLIETFELDLANTGLVGLDELSFLRLFASTQARALVQGTGHSLRDIRNADGVPLYPAFYRTRLRIPQPRLLSRHQTWERVDLGVDIHRFGSMLLESKGVLASAGALGADPASWNLEELIHVEGSMAFVHDVGARGETRVDAPREGATVTLQPLRERPPSLEEQRRVRREGVLGGAADPSRLIGRLEQTVFLGRDLQTNRALMFSGFTSLLQVAEQSLLVKELRPALDPALLSHEYLLEREIFYVDNVHQGDTVVVDSVASLAPCPREAGNAYEGLVGGALFEIRSEVHHTESNRLLAVARTRKIFLVPRTRGNDLQDIQRMLHRHGGRS